MEDLPSPRTRGSSPLSSLSPSPQPELRPTKRARVSSSPPSQQPLFLAPHRSPPLDQPLGDQREDLSALLEGLDEQEFDLPPSSDPVMRMEHEEEEEGEDSNTLKPGLVETGKSKRVEADDSGIGLLPLDDRGEVGVDDKAKDRERSVEPPDKGHNGEDEEFEGDDMWLGFDDADMGFDQPDAFPSSVGSIVPLALGKDGPNTASEGPRVEEEVPEEANSKPADLASFGFATVGLGGFAFASRKPFVPSAAALRRAKDLIDDNESGSTTDVATSDPSGKFPGRPDKSTFTAPRPLAPRAAPSPSLVPALQDPSSSSSSTFCGFQSAGGRSFALPTEDALLKARRKWEETSPPSLFGKPKSIPSSAVPSRAPSRNAKPNVDLFGPGGAENQEPQSFSLQPVALPAETYSQSSSKDRVNDFDSPTIVRTRSFVPNEFDSTSTKHEGRSPLAPVDNVDALGADDDSRSDNGSTATLTSSSPHKRDTSPRPAPPQARPPVAAFSTSDPPSDVFANQALPPPGPKFKPPASVRAAGTSAQSSGSLAHRSPLITSARQASQAQSSTPLRPSALSSSSAAFAVASAPVTATPLFNRRLNLGMTPRNKPYHLANTLPSSSSGRKKGKGFVTPFKGGKPPAGLTPMGLKEKTEAAMALAGAKGTPVLSVSKPRARASRLGEVNAKERQAKVFDIELSNAQPRFNLFDYGMRPQTHFFEELETLGLSEEVLSMNAVSAAGFAFPCGRSVRDAFKSLKALVATRSPDEEELVTLPWVENHWSLIVWKLASYVRTRPDLLDTWWRFEMVMDQLRYRYEREINQAQRSAIKRIQERDSPAALPLVLCVSQLLWDDPIEGEEDSDEGTQVIVGLELTDGWYRIRAKIDPALKSACERGKLIIGSKVAIIGARLEKTKGDGIDVLEALGRSKLVISGNSTSLAPWHATLGFSGISFFASLDSLSSTGGSVAPIDIVIEKIFELGYVDATRMNSGTWGEAEERERAEEWERGRSRIHDRMADAADKDGSEEDDLVALLLDAVQGSAEEGPPARGAKESDSEDPDEIFEQIESASNKRAVLRKLSPQCLQACLLVARERASRSREQSHYELRQELDQKYPPRQIRSVRMMRIKDARQGVNGPIERQAILTVWDVKDYASDFFREGKRYQVTNTIVKGNWQRRHKEISLHTKKDSKWTRI